MIYAQAKDSVFATALRPDGYFGDTERVGFAYDPASGRTYEVAQCGCYLSVIPPATDRAEALWMLLNHPTPKSLYSRVIVIQEALCKKI